VDPTLADVRSRVETLRFRTWESALSDARAAEQAGRFDEALAGYQRASAASPESPFLYRDMARMERQLGRLDEAIDHVNRAIALDPSDASAYLLQADLYEARGQWEEAIAALERARDRDVTADLEARLEALRRRVALARLPAEYRAIGAGDRVTRGDLAALLGVRLESLLREGPRRDSVLVTDVRNHWAQPWIMTVAAAGVMEPFENHTFQPRAIVRRGDLARAVSGALTLIARRNTALGRAWSAARQTFGDLAPGNLYYPAASLAVVAGVLDAAPGGRFEAGRAVSGTEAVQAVERLEKLAADAGGSR
jgi:tetratricopeptide (TPR) repeat protein